MRAPLRARRLALARAAAALLLVCSAAGVRAADLDEVLKRWDSDAHGDLCSVLVLRGGAVVAERYYNGATADALHDVRSAGKSITALLVSAALDRGKIASVADPVQRYWPAARGSALGDVTIADLLTMRSGLAAFDEDAASPGNEDKLDEAADPLAFTLAVPRAQPPGQQYRYNSLTAYAAGIVVEQATGQDLEAFARTALFAPLGIARWHWGRDAAGHPKGQGNLSLRTRDLASIGQLVLGGGQFGGRTVLSAGAVRAAIAPRVDIGAGDRYADSYGYFWYAKTHVVGGRTLPVHFASGNGGNKIYVVPALNMVAVVTSRAYGRGYGQLRSENILKAILAAVD